MTLDKLRLEKGISAASVYRKLQIDKATFSKLERKKTSLKVEWVPILAKLYGVTEKFIIDDYLDRKEEHNNDCN